MAKVTVSGWVWFRKEDLEPEQIANLRRKLTIFPKRTTDIAQARDPEPMYLYKDTGERFGIPRGFYSQNASGKHEEELLVSRGTPMKDMGTLWRADGPYVEQGNVVDAIVDKMQAAPYWGGLLEAQTGAGKTVMAVEIARRMGLRTLILVHQEFFLNQWTERILEFMPDATIGIIRQNKCEYEKTKDGKEPDFVIGLLQSLAKDKGKYPKEMWSAFGLVVSDECFVGSTLVRTLGGVRPISEIREGDAVLNAAGLGVVTAAGSRLVDLSDMRIVRFEDGSEYLSTADHPYLGEHGWQEAVGLDGCGVVTHDGCMSLWRKNEKSQNSGDVRGVRQGEFGQEGEEILLSSMRGGSKESGTSSVRAMRGDKGEVGQKSFLLSALSDELDERSTIVPGGSFVWREEMARRESPCAKRGIGENGSQEPDGRSRDEGEGVSHAAGDGPLPAGSGWERQGLDRASAGLTGRIGERLGGGTDSSDWHASHEHRGVSESLQDRYCTRRDDGCDRGGRPVSFVIRGKGKGCQERDVPFSVRVESVAIPEQADLGRFGVRLEGDKVRVFNLSVSGHPSYVLSNGAVVHNCHRVASQSWSTVIPRFNSAFRLGLSATMRRLDGTENVFFYHFGEIAYSAKIKAMTPMVTYMMTETELKDVRRGSYHVKASKLNSAQTINQLCADDVRTRQIAERVADAVLKGRKVMVVSERIVHLAEIGQGVRSTVKARDPKFQLTIDAYTGEWFANGLDEKYISKNTKKVKRGTEELRRAEKANVLLTTKQMTAEGFDLAAIDVIVLASPFSDPEQIVGRVRRWCFPKTDKCEHYCAWRAGECEEKPIPVVIDVVDPLVPRALGRAKRRKRFYTKMNKEDDS